MRGLVYLSLTTLKNSLKQVVKKPAKLAAYIVFIALLAVTVIGADMPSVPSERSDMSEFYALIFALYFVVFVISVNKGFSQGASFFSMPDVNMIFPAPISNTKVLFYGLIKQIKQSFLLAFFLFYQYYWLNVRYAVTMADILIVFVGYAFIVFSAQIISMLIYSFTSADERRKNIVKRTFYAVCILIGASVILPALSDLSNGLHKIIAGANAVWTDCIPIAGWLKMSVRAMMEGAYSTAITGAGIYAATIGLLFAVIIKKRHDYYEDVLSSTEASYSAVLSAKQGRMTGAPGNVKLGKQGINKGRGASAILYKHLLENRRSSIFLIDKMSLIFIVIHAFYAVFIKNMESEFAIILSMGLFSVYLLIFSIPAGRWAKEVMLPYIYLIPENPVKKLIYVCMSSMISLAAESLLIFAVTGMILKFNLMIITVLAISRFSFGLIMIAVNFLIERIFGAKFGKGISLLLYMIFTLIASVPGIVLGMMTSAVFGGMLAFAVGLGVLIVSNALIAFLILFLCKDVLAYSELNN